MVSGLECVCARQQHIVESGGAEGLAIKLKEREREREEEYENIKFHFKIIIKAEKTKIIAKVEKRFEVKLITTAGEVTG